MPSSHLILCRPLFLLPPIPPSIRVFFNKSTLCMRWPKYWSFSFSIIPSKEHPGLISFRMDWLDVLAVQGTLKRRQMIVKWRARMSPLLSVKLMLENVSNSGIPIFILQNQTRAASHGQCQVQASLPTCGLPLYHFQHGGAEQNPSFQCWRRATHVAGLSLYLQTGRLPT